MWQDHVDQVVVTHNGSRNVRAGFGGEDAPLANFRTIVGTNNRTNVVGMSPGRWYVADEAYSKRSLLTISHPIERGIVTNWDEMEKVMEWTFSKELSIDPTNHAVLQTEAPWNPDVNKVKMFELMFDKFQVPSFCVCNEAVLALQAAGRETGMVLNSGHTITYAAAIHEGHMIEKASKLDIGGKDLMPYLLTMLEGRGYRFNTSAQVAVVQEILETMCIVSLDFPQDSIIAKDTSNFEKSYEYPNGALLSVNDETFRCPEALFQPSLVGIESSGIHELIYQSIISNQDQTLRKELFSNIVIAGGNTLYPGIDARLRKELTELAPVSYKVKIIAPPERAISPWIGGSLFTQSPSFHAKSILKATYEEHGPSIATHHN